MSFEGMNRTELRVACKAAGIAYGKLTVAQMKDALSKLANDDEAVEEVIEELVEELVEQVVEQVVEEVPAELTVSSESVDQYFGAMRAAISAAQDPEEQAEDVKPSGVFKNMVIEANRVTPPKQPLSIQKNREKRNGVTRPSAGGACAQIWDICFEREAEVGVEAVTLKDVKHIASEKGLNPTNATCEFYNWRKFVGYKK